MSLEVSIPYHRSETSYRFGPFTEDELNKFLDKLNEVDPNCEKYGEPFVYWVNDPELFGTGQETALE
jgi:hypothetical protein